MNLEAYRKHCLAKKGVTEEFPFDENVMVFKVMGKIFSLTDVETFDSISLKADPERAIELRERHESVVPGYHLNKKHWITVLMDGSIPDTQVRAWTDESYSLVVAGLSKSQKKALETL